MKNTIRVRKNRSGRSSARQAKTRDEFALPENSVHPTCLSLYCRSSKRAFSKIPLSDEEFLQVINAANRLGQPSSRMTIVNFIADAVRDKLAQSNPIAFQPPHMQEKPASQPAEPRFGWPHELEAASQQSHALTYLMFDCLSRDTGGTPGDDIQCGIVELMSETSQRLDVAAAAIRSIISKPREVAS